MFDSLLTFLSKGETLSSKRTSCQNIKPNKNSALRKRRIALRFTHNNKYYILVIFITATQLPWEAALLLKIIRVQPFHLVGRYRGDSNPGVDHQTHQLLAVNQHDTGINERGILYRF